MRIARSAAALVEKGFAWVYRDRVQEPQAIGPGELLQVEDQDGRILGTAYGSNRSKIALRFLTRGTQVPDEKQVLRDRMRKAAALRERILPGRQARRLIYSEADGIPGLVVDQYGDALSLQLLTQSADQREGLLLELLTECFNPRQIVLRNDVKVRELEGLKVERKIGLGEAPFQVEIQFGKVRQVIDLWEGQKTGTFLDQQENHALLGRIAKGRVLDLFCYGGGFALQAASVADSVVAVDSSKPALAWAEESARRSGLTNIEWVPSNVFDWLKGAKDQAATFDTIIVDPPAFAKRRSDLAAAQKAYRDLNRRALSLLAPGGLLVTCSCSYNLSEEDLVDLVRQAAESVGRPVSLLERRGQSPDHPESLGLPESRYLKCLVLTAHP